MSLIRTFLFVFFLQSALSEEPLVKPCSKYDLACLRNAAQSFLDKTYAGVADLDIRPIDPMTINYSEMSLDSGDKVYLRNVVVTKLKKLVIHDFTMDTIKKSVVLTMEGDPGIVGDIEVESNGSKISGRFSAKGLVFPTAKYTYDLVPNDKGVEYFTVGKETIECTLQDTADVQVDDDIGKILWKESEKTAEIKKKVLCSVITPAFETIIHNLRQSAKIYPKTAYFTDLY